MQGLPIGTHNIKLRPVSGDEVLGADRVDRLSLAVTGKAMVRGPSPGCGRYARGIPSAVSWSPVDVAFGGAGTRTENENEPVPAGFSGDFVLTAAGTEHVVNGTSITLTRSGRFALSVTARQLGYVSPAAYVTVESQDGEYVAYEPGIPTDKNAMAYFPWPEFRAIGGAARQNKQGEDVMASLTRPA